MMTENDQPQSLVIELIEMLRNASHRDERRAFDVADGVLFRFPNVNHTKRGFRVPKLGDFRRGYLNWQLFHRPRV